MFQLDPTKKDLLNKIYTSQFSHNAIIPGPYGHRYNTYADYIASGQSLTFVEDFIEKAVLPSFANTHTESSYTGLQSTHLREEARAIIKSSINASDDDAVIFTGSGSTGAMDLLNRKLNQHFANETVKPLVLIGPYEHHSNILPWREGPYELVELPLSRNGNVDLIVLEQVLKQNHQSRPIIGSFSAASNVTGIIAPIAKIHKLLKQYGALSFWDFAGAAPYVDINMNPEGIDGLDAIFISTHKFMGGPGTPGVLAVKKNLLSGELPAVVGGGTVQLVTKTQQKYLGDPEAREEGGTPAIIGSIRAGLVFKLKDEVGAKTIEQLEAQYIKRALKAFSTNDNIEVLGDLKSERLSFMSFMIKYNGQYLHYNFVVALLNDLFGIQSRGGCSCAGTYGHDLLNITEAKSQQHMNLVEKGISGSKPGWTRVNFNYFIPEEEFQYIIKAIKWVAKNGWKLLNHYDFNYEKGLWVSKESKPEPVISLGNFLHQNTSLDKGTTEERKVTWVTNFLIANELAAQELPKSSHPEVEASTCWYALHKKQKQNNMYLSLHLWH
ncbi:MAG: aminotransferase class V-fold PLP-dependent enzyme [Schleiferiaceae bacterium]|nr:aminotransferase class V-fold PLP-dependent enzyme [Schleiferiaceae bacterium]